MTPDPRWYTLEDAAEMCHRSTKTIENLVAQYQLPRRLGWRVKQRKRRRVMFFTLATVQRMQDLTLFKPPRSDQKGQTQLVPPPGSAPPPSDGPTSAP